MRCPRRRLPPLQGERLFFSRSRGRGIVRPVSVVRSKQVYIYDSMDHLSGGGRKPLVFKEFPPEIIDLIRSKSTAFGRATRRASSDPACILSVASSAWSSGNPPVVPRQTEVNDSYSAIHDAPNGGFLTSMAPSGGLPDTSASGRGDSWIYLFTYPRVSTQ